MTLWVFLSQVLNADHSCRGAVTRFLAYRLAQGQPACSSKTGGYCQARKRLPMEFVANIARTIGRKLEDRAEQKWLWKGHHVYMFDGTTTLMPDTAEIASRISSRLAGFDRMRETPWRLFARSKVSASQLPVPRVQSVA